MYLIFSLSSNAIDDNGSDESPVVYFLPNCYFREFGGPWVSLDKGYMLIWNKITPSPGSKPTFEGCWDALANEIVRTCCEYYPPLFQKNYTIHAFLATHSSLLFNIVASLCALRFIAEDEIPENFRKIPEMVVKPETDVNTENLRWLIDWLLNNSNSCFNVSFYVLQNYLSNKLRTMDYGKLRFFSREGASIEEKRFEMVRNILIIEPDVLNLCLDLIKNFPMQNVSELSDQFEGNILEDVTSGNPNYTYFYQTLMEIGVMYLFDEAIEIEKDKTKSQIHLYIQKCAWKRKKFSTRKVQPQLREKMLAASLLCAETRLLQLAVKFKHLQGSAVPRILEKQPVEKKSKKDLIPALLWLIEDEDLELENEILDFALNRIKTSQRLSSKVSFEGENWEKQMVENVNCLTTGKWPELNMETLKGDVKKAQASQKMQNEPENKVQQQLTNQTEENCDDRVASGAKGAETIEKTPGQKRAVSKSKKWKTPEEENGETPQEQRQNGDQMTSRSETLEKPECERPSSGRKKATGKSRERKKPTDQKRTLSPQTASRSKTPEMPENILVSSSRKSSAEKSKRKKSPKNQVDAAIREPETNDDHSESGNKSKKSSGKNFDPLAESNQNNPRNKGGRNKRPEKQVKQASEQSGGKIDSKKYGGNQEPKQPRLSSLSSVSSAGSDLVCRELQTRLATLREQSGDHVSKVPKVKQNKKLMSQKDWERARKEATLKRRLTPDEKFELQIMDAELQSQLDGINM